MKTFCETFNQWLYHPVDTSFLCENRAKKLGISECRKCRGIEVPKSKPLTIARELIPEMITLDIDKDRWVRAVRNLQDEYEIQEGTKQDETSARRIAILMGELYLSRFTTENPTALFNVTIIEKDAFELAIEYRLKCDPLEREERLKGKDKKQVLLTWGVDRVSGMEGYTTQLKEWTATALLAKPETGTEEIQNGEFSLTGNDHGRGVDETPGHEERRVEIFARRERDALRRVEQEAQGLS